MLTVKKVAVAVLGQDAIQFLAKVLKIVAVAALVLPVATALPVVSPAAALVILAVVVAA